MNMKKRLPTTINTKHDKKCQEYLNVRTYLSAVYALRAELSGMYGPYGQPF